MRNLCEYVDTYVRKYTWPKLRGVAMCVCVRACEKKNAKFNSKAISWFLRKFAPSKISRYTVPRAHVRANTEKMRDCHLVARTCDNEVVVGVAISIRDPYTSPFTSRCK